MRQRHVGGAVDVVATRLERLAGTILWYTKFHKEGNLCPICSRCPQCCSDILVVVAFVEDILTIICLRTVGWLVRCTLP